MCTSRDLHQFPSADSRSLIRLGSGRPEDCGEETRGQAGGLRRCQQSGISEGHPRQHDSRAGRKVRNSTARHLRWPRRKQVDEGVTGSAGGPGSGGGRRRQLPSRWDDICHTWAASPKSRWTWKPASITQPHNFKTEESLGVPQTALVVSQREQCISGLARRAAWTLLAPNWPKLSQ